MALTERQLSGGIRFGDWMLAPLDDKNWELCHWHVSQAVGRHPGGTEPQWHRLGRYYQRNTIYNAILYAADAELREDARGSVVMLDGALRVWRETVERLKADVIAALA